MRRIRPLSRLVLAVLLALALLAGASSVPSRAEQPNGAGLVVRFGDGRVVTAYVQFEEPAITGIELLQRSGIPITVAPFGGLGLAVCAIAGEGCPAEDCFCQAKQQPAWFWHYYGLAPEGRWVLHSVGASHRLLRDGDVDGWSWTSGESGLPAITIDDIARAHGVERAREPSPLPTPPAGAVTPTPLPTVPAGTPSWPATPQMLTPPQASPWLATPTTPPPMAATPTPPLATATTIPNATPPPETALPSATAFFPVVSATTPRPPPSPSMTPPPTPGWSTNGPPWMAIVFLGLGALGLIGMAFRYRWRQWR